MREQARSGHPLFQPLVFENLGNLALSRDYNALGFHRDKWLQALAKQRNEEGDLRDPQDLRRVRPIDVLAFALMIQSVFVDRQLKHDMQVVAQRKGLEVGDPYQHCFYALWPDPLARRAFNQYVESKWPIHVFSLDPAVDQQNQLDLYSARTELQLALATAVATGQVNFQNATTYARRLEQDLAAINLNRTAVGFGAGESTFGWRFYPRIQTPPTQSNPRRILGILVNNGPGPDYALNNLRIEPGQRECYALMVVPNFAPAIKMTTITNWFDLKTSHPDQELDTTDMIGLGRKLQTARNAMQRLCDSGKYRPVDLELLGDRLSQLEAMLPMQSHEVLLPFEADLSGAEIFTSTNAALGPRLLTWYGEPGQAGGSIFLLGSGFSVRDMKVIAGGSTLKDTDFDLISRNVLRIDIPKTAKSIRTPVVYKDPTYFCFNQGIGKDNYGKCDDCVALMRAASTAGVAVNAAESVANAAESAARVPAAKAEDVSKAARVKSAEIAIGKNETASKAAKAVADAAADAATKKKSAGDTAADAREPLQRQSRSPMRRKHPRSASASSAGSSMCTSPRPTGSPTTS